MVSCPVCDAVLEDVEEDDLDEGEELTCQECGTSLTVIGLDPLEIEPTSEEDEEEDEDEDADEDELDEEEEEESEDEDWR
ncbi:MAG TPA: hypothetical protein VE621_09535 [Bryobacteraceae bacterium]|nr:hypothetical protein [Bryobacteraceae bacterium]